MATTLTSSSTIAQIEAEYKTSADWFGANSVALAKRHVTAITYLLLVKFSNQTKGANSLTQRIDLLQKQQDLAMDFVRRFDPTWALGLRVTQARVDCSDFRGRGEGLTR